MALDLWIPCVGLICVVLLYALPILLAYVRQDKLLYAETPDDTLYEVRVTELYRGGSLENPYLAEHENSHRYMPQLVEGLFAQASKITTMPPLLLIAISRVLLPAMIFLLVWGLSVRLDLQPQIAFLAGLTTTSAPSLSVGMYALRYFRVISPAAHVLVFVGALWLVCSAWRAPSWRNCVAAGIGLGILFYFPVYYWSCGVLGTSLLAALSQAAIRRRLFLSTVIALMVGSLSLLHSWHISTNPEVRETLGRLLLMVPGRAPEFATAPKLILGMASTAVAWWYSRKSVTAARFVLPFCAAATFMLVQNVVTNRQIQAYHMINCLIPLWAVLASVVLQFYERFRRVWTFAIAGLIIGTGLIVQISSYQLWSYNIKRDPALFALDTLMPRTIKWLNVHTNSGSVVLTKNNSITDSLPLFTRNRLYVAQYVFQYVISDRELEVRESEAQNWRPGQQLTFRADYFLGLGLDCATVSASEVLFSDEAEHTCIVQLAH